MPIIMILLAAAADLSISCPESLQVLALSSSRVGARVEGWCPGVLHTGEPLSGDAVVAGVSALRPQEHEMESSSQWICPRVPLLNHP